MILDNQQTFASVTENLQIHAIITTGRKPKREDNLTVPFN